MITKDEEVRKLVAPQWEGVYEFMDAHELLGHTVYCQLFVYPVSGEKRALFFACNDCTEKFWPSPWKAYLGLGREMIDTTYP